MGAFIAFNDIVVAAWALHKCAISAISALFPDVYLLTLIACLEAHSLDFVTFYAIY